MTSPIVYKTMRLVISSLARYLRQGTRTARGWIDFVASAGFGDEAQFALRQRGQAADMIFLNIGLEPGIERSFIDLKCPEPVAGIGVVGPQHAGGMLWAGCGCLDSGFVAYATDRHRRHTGDARAAGGQS